MKAVVFVDVQNDFVKGGVLAYGYPEKSNTEKLVAFAHDCLAKGYALYATQDTHDDDYMNTLEGKKLPVPHCIEGTPGHEVIDLLHKDADGNVIIPYGRMIQKPTFGSFDLIDKIFEDFGDSDEPVGSYGERLEEIIICGYCTSICVVSNALMLRAQYPNVKITVRADLCGDIDQTSHEAALHVMRNCQINIAEG